jgi:hypothetical protein
MSPLQNRRDFLGTAACTGSCMLLACFTARTLGADATADAKKTYDFDKLTYCCFECDRTQCPLLEASLSNDLEAKKKQAAVWREKFGREFSPEEVFCFGCKVEPARQGFAVKHCDARQCVIDKKLISCAHCPELKDCARKLWANYPKFREHVLAIQKEGQLL